MSIQLDNEMVYFTCMASIAWRLCDNRQQFDRQQRCRKEDHMHACALDGVPVACRLKRLPSFFVEGMQVAPSSKQLYPLRVST